MVKSSSNGDSVVSMAEVKTLILWRGLPAYSWRLALSPVAMADSVTMSA